MIQMDFLLTLKQLRLMLFKMFYCRRIYLVVSSIFHQTWIKRARLQQHYMNDPQFALQLRMITALAFLPPHDVVNSFN